MKTFFLNPFILSLLAMVVTFFGIPAVATMAGYWAMVLVTILLPSLLFGIGLYCWLSKRGRVLSFLCAGLVSIAAVFLLWWD